MKKTKIIATIWPATNSKEKLIELYNSWVNIIRFNFSHANYEETKKIVDLIKTLNKSWITNLSLLLDTKGPEIRSWVLENPIKYKEWDKFKIFVDEKKIFWEKSLFCDYNFLVDDLKIWQNIVIDSGLLTVEVISKTKDYLEVISKSEAIIWSRRHINLPWINLKLPWITNKDIEDINFAIDNDFDFIAASFVRNKECVNQIKDIFKKRENNYIKIISKIENQEWIDNLEEIVSSSHWVMVARWDLWVEVPVEKLSLYQKGIVEKCKLYGKFVIIATHLLETMIENQFPTRAETSDIFNSVLQKPDCLMLSWETAVWKYPIEAVKLMVKVVKEAESHIIYKHDDYFNDWLRDEDIEKKVLIRSGIFIWEELNAKALVVITKSWILARLASFFRPKIQVFAFTKFEKTSRYINALFWVEPIFHPKRNSENFFETMDWAVNYLIENNLVEKWNKIIAINDIKKWNKDVSMMEILNV